MSQITNLDWENYKKTGDIEIRNKIVNEYLYLVKIIVKKLTVSYCDRYDIDDLYSYGIIGLIDSVEKYNIDKGVKFETYASFRIRGSIIDQIRKLDWAPRNLRQKIKYIEDAYEKLEKKKGSDVSDDEVAEYLKIDIHEYHQIIQSMNTFNVISLDDMLLKSYENIRSEDQVTPEKQYLYNELKEVVSEVIETKLTEKEKTVISLYYYENLSLKEISKVLDVTESRVSQIHSKSLEKLRKSIYDYQGIER